MLEYFLTLTPKFESFLNLLSRWRSRRSLRVDGLSKILFLGILGLIFWIGIYVVFYRVLIYLQGVEEIGDLLAERLLSMVFLTFFSILIFSNIIVSLSTFYTSHELQLLLSSPISHDKIFLSKFIETMTASSWMVLSFGLPVFIAYGVAYKSSLYYYIELPFISLLFITIPAGLGIMITTIIASAVPARRARGLFFLMAIFAFVLLYLLLRFLRPERFVDPEAFSSLIGYITELTIPSSPWLPSYWATQAIFPLMLKANSQWQDISFYLLMLLSTALASTFLSGWVSKRLYYSGWERSQQVGRRTSSKTGLIENPLSIIRSPERRALVVKDIKIFLRDTVQWSQLFLLLALVIVYLYNFKVLPFGRVTMASFYLKNLISFLNLGLAGLVLSAITARFIYPAISLEGDAYWVVRSSPTNLKDFLWSKFWTGFIPLLFLAELLIVFSNRILKVTDFMMALSTITIFIMIFGITGLGLGLGAIYPRFRFENIARIPMGFGGVLYMIFSMAFIGVTVILEAWPVYILFWARFIGRALSSREILILILFFSSVIFLNIIVFYLPMRLGLKSLEEREI